MINELSKTVKKGRVYSADLVARGEMKIEKRIPQQLSSQQRLGLLIYPWQV